MAPGRKTGGRNFKPGVITNPAGRPKVPPELRELKRLNSVEFHETVVRLTRMTHQELQEYAKSGTATMLELMIVGQIQASVKGKTSPLSLLLERTVGPVKQIVELSANVEIVSAEQAQRMAERMLKKKDE